MITVCCNNCVYACFCFFRVKCATLVSVVDSCSVTLLSSAVMGRYERLTQYCLTLYLNPIVVFAVAMDGARDIAGELAWVE